MRIGVERVARRERRACGVTTLSEPPSRPKEGRRGGASWATSRPSAGREKEKEKEVGPILELGWKRGRREFFKNKSFSISSFQIQAKFK